MKLTYPALIAAAVLCHYNVAVADSATATEPGLKQHVEYLASEELEGRMTGSEGSKKAADYLASLLKDAGLKPGGDDNTYLQKFEFSAGVEAKPDSNKLEILYKDGFTSEPQSAKSFQPLGFTANKSVSGEVVFAGYGLKVPDKENSYDSYAGIDVKDKIVLILRYVPENVSPERRAELNRYAGLRYKAMLAREHGAKGVLVVTGPNSPGSGELVPVSADAGMSGSDIPAVSITLDVAQDLFGKAGKDIKTIQGQLDNENPHADTGFSVPDTTVTLSTSVNRMHKPDNNVIGILPPSGGSTEYVMIGAHYDHLGHGEAGAMKRKGEETEVHYGADDNASGCSVIAEIAEYISETRKNANTDKPTRGLIVAFWSGEEIGIIGSSHYAEHPTVPLKDVVAYINFDMVGRLREKLNLQGIGSSTSWKQVIEKSNVAAGLNLSLQEDPYLPTDTTAFYVKQIPCLNFFTGSHEDYHRPTDTADKLNYEGMESIVQLAANIINNISKSEKKPDYVKVERSDQGGSRDNLRVYIGSIPDYTSEIAGVKLSGVRGGSPAEKGGLKGNDIIVEFAGQKISNIYDYTYALDAAKIGTPLKVQVLRDKTTVTLTITPEARK